MDLKSTEDEIISAIMEIDDIKEVYHQRYRHMDENIKKMSKRSGLIKSMKGDYTDEFSFRKARKCAKCIQLPNGKTKFCAEHEAQRKLAIIVSKNKAKVTSSILLKNESTLWKNPSFKKEPSFQKT